MILYGASLDAWTASDPAGAPTAAGTARALEEAAGLGFSGVEAGDGADPARLAGALAPLGLRLAAARRGTRLLRHPPAAEMAALRAPLAALRAAGCAVLVLRETTAAVDADPARPLSERPVLSRSDWKAFCAGLSDLALRLEDEGFLPVCEHRLGTIVQTADDIDRLLDGTGEALKLALDPGHAFLAGIDPARLAADYIERVGQIRATDARPAARRRLAGARVSLAEAVGDGAFALPGGEDGGVDFAAVLKPAARAGWSGWIVLGAERDPTAEDLSEDLARGLAAIRSAAKEAGFDPTAL